MNLFDSFKKLSGRIAELFKTSDKKKLVENIIIVLILGIIIIIAGSSIFRSKGTAESKAKQLPSGTNQAEEVSAQTSDMLVAELEKILSQIEGAGRVSVMITYVSDEEKVPAYDTKRKDNETQEKDSNGGTRNIKEYDIETSVVYEQEGSGTKFPVILKKLKPAVKGVLVVADGAGDQEVKEKLSRAIQTLMDAPPHKVQVFERKK